MYKKRLYRTKTLNSDLLSFNATYFESDLLIYAHSDLKAVASKKLQQIHEQVSVYCHKNPDFEKSLTPVKIGKTAPKIIQIMHKASLEANVGPMATVAGAIAEVIGKQLLRQSPEIIIENGGDCFLKTSKTRRIGIFAGIGNVYNKLSMKIEPEQTPCGICTSSGQFGHSFSKGKSSATIIIAKSSALADGYATAYGNMILQAGDIDSALKSAQQKKEILGALFITDSKMGAYGDFTFDILDK